VTRIALSTLLVLGLVLFVAGCSQSTPSRIEPQQDSDSSQASETPEQAVRRILGDGATVDAVDTEDLAGRPPHARLSVSVVSTPSASAVMGLLADLEERYAGDGRWVQLQVDLPSDGGFFLRYNPTDSAITVDGGNTPLVPHAITLMKGSGEGWKSWTVTDSGVTVASNVTTAAVNEASLGRGDLLDALRSVVPLP